MDYKERSNRLGHSQFLWPDEGLICPPANGLRHVLAESARLRALIAEYSAYGLAVPNGLAKEFETVEVMVKAAIAEDRRQRLLAAQAEVERLRSQEEKLAEAKLRLERIENEVRAAEGK